MTVRFRRVLPWLLGASLGLAATAAAASNSPAGHAVEVDPRIGTGGDGHTFPGATVPFGMVQLSPDTAMPDFKHAYKWAAGYRYDDPSIMGFSHTHFSGSGHSDLGDVLVMPIAGDVQLEPGDASKPGSGYRSRFSHTTEVEQAGYYAVTLSDYDVRAELTAGRRIGWHRYGFPVGKPAHVLLDLRPSIYDYPGKVLWASLQVHADGTMTAITPHSDEAFTVLAPGLVEETFTHGPHTSFEVFADGNGDGIYTAVAHGEGVTVDLAGLQAQLTTVTPFL